MPRSASAKAANKRSTSKKQPAKAASTASSTAAATPAKKQPTVSPELARALRADHDQPKQDLMDSLFPNIDWAGWAVWWNTNAVNWFPSWMGTNISSFATFNFYLSLVTTFITPFVRWFTGSWRAEVPSVWYANLFLRWIGQLLALIGIAFNYQLPLLESIQYKIDPKNYSTTAPLVDYKNFTATNTPNMDTTWMMHATAGLTWLCVSYLQIKVIPKYAPSWHPRTGPAALLVLFIHLGVALNILIHDQQKQYTLNKVALSSLTFIAATYAMIGAYKAVRYMLSENKSKALSLINDHKDRMIIGWLWSISGAGPIRIVAAITEPFGIGPLRCQQEHAGTSIDCLWPYFNRLVMIATWNLLMTGVYCKIRGSTALTTTWVKNIACHIVVCISFGLLGLIPGSMQFIDGALGCATSDRSWIMTYIMWVMQALQLTIFFPLLFVLLSVMGPGMLFGYILAIVTGFADKVDTWCPLQ